MGEPGRIHRFAHASDAVAADSGIERRASDQRAHIRASRPGTRTVVLSLDANNPLAVWAARLSYRLAFFHAHMHVVEDGSVVAFRSARRDASAAKPTFDAAWQVGDTRPAAEPGTLDFFLLERYVLYSGSNDHLLRARIHHRPWPLRRATFRHLSSTMLEAQGLPRQTDAPLIHAQAVPFDVDIWAPTRVSG